MSQGGEAAGNRNFGDHWGELGTHAPQGTAASPFQQDVARWGQLSGGSDCPKGEGHLDFFNSATSQPSEMVVD